MLIQRLEGYKYKLVHPVQHVKQVGETTKGDNQLKEKPVKEKTSEREKK